AAGSIDIEASIEHNIVRVAKALGKGVGDVTVMILDRPRNEATIREVRAVGSRCALITDGDIAGVIATTKADSGVDMLLGIGGSPEAVTAACAMKALGGELQCKIWPRNDAERQYAADNSIDLDRVLLTHDLVASDDTFFAATGVTPSALLNGIQMFGNTARTHSVVMRSRTGTVRFVEAIHRFDRVKSL
ncbi:MAG: fructose-bisphosphatase class II, partial [Acidobacteria bacterium]|nr:fructose-bisphosphatase class II [Acidobacteriota bacterium]